MQGLAAAKVQHVGALTRLRRAVPEGLQACLTAGHVVFARLSGILKALERGGRAGACERADAPAQGCA